MGGLFQCRALLLVGVAFLLGGCSGSTSHSMHYLSTWISKPGRGLPQVTIVGYVDDQLFVQYDSNTWKALPRVPWMKKVQKKDWDWLNEYLQVSELRFKERLATVKNHYNQSGGFQTIQRIHGCGLSPDGRKRAFKQYGCDGRDLVSFDKETLTWMAANREVQITKVDFDAEVVSNQICKAYLEGDCNEWLKRYLDYGKEFLPRTERPVGKVTRQPRLDGQESLICQAYGFYPRDIDTTWRRDGEVMEHATFRRDVAPNSDGTYHAWLSIDVDPQDKNRYSCHIEHDSLVEPLVLAWEEPGNVWFIVGATLGVMVALLLVSGIIFIILSQQHKKADYKAAPASSQRSHSSARELRHPGMR